MEHKKKIKIAIILLAVLLGLSLLALGGTLIYDNLANGVHSTVTVPGNLITPEGEALNVGGETKNPNETSSDNASSSESTDTTIPNTEEKQATNIELYSKQPEENTTFQIGNMFPGDSEIKYFRVRISYHDTITMNLKATVRSEDKKLAEVLKVRIKLPATGETLYDGTIADMPESVTYKLTTTKSVTDELYYEITAYLDTSVGNEYQNENLTADFRWWVDEPENLNSLPKISNILMYLLVTLIVLCTVGMIIYLVVVIRKRKEDTENGEKK